MKHGTFAHQREYLHEYTQQLYCLKLFYDFFYFLGNFWFIYCLYLLFFVLNVYTYLNTLILTSTLKQRKF